LKTDLTMKKKTRFFVILILSLVLPVAMMIMMAMKGAGRYATPGQKDHVIFMHLQAIHVWLPTAAPVRCMPPIMARFTRSCASPTEKPSTLV
jgi:hypothetical protein